MSDNGFNVMEFYGKRMNELLENDKKIIEMLKDINRELKIDNDKYENQQCSLCFEEITQEDYEQDNVIDDPTTYGLCHKCCFEEAEDDRLY